MLTIYGNPVFSQSANRYNLEAGLFGTVASESLQPFWLTSNRQGIFEDGSANSAGYVSLIRPPGEGRGIRWGGGVSLLGRASENSSLFFQEAWLSAAVGIVELTAGRVEKRYGITFGRLSSGSLLMSGNAAPVPGITLSVPKFEPVPFTGGRLEFKGHFSHSWLEEGRRALDIPSNSPTGLQNSRIHDKSFYLRTGGDTGRTVYLGIVHAAEWGGLTAAGRQIPGGVDDFLRVVTAKSGGSGTPGGDRVNALGAHTGVWDMGVTADIGMSGFHLYHQHLFTDGSGLRLRNLQDGLYGLGVANPLGDRPIVTGFLWEFLYTRDQSGRGLPDPMAGDSPDFCDGEPNCGYTYNGRDDYYNNYFYLSGWSYHSRPLGNPFFLTRDRLGFVDSEGRSGNAGSETSGTTVNGVETFSDRYFVSTRLVAHHFGLEGLLGEQMTYRLLVSWNRHYGTYWGSNLGGPWGSLDPELDQEVYYFNPPRHQWYLMVETEWQVPAYEQISLQLAVGIDRGDLFNNFGILSGLVFDLSPRRTQE